VQPIIAKQILPWFGGSAAVWTTCLVFFQSVLLAGYAYADLTLRLGARRTKDGLVEGRRRLLQLAQRRRHAPRLVQRRFLLAALGAAGEVALHLRGASRIELAVGEVEEQVLGLGVRHALPSLTSTTGSSEAASSETPAAASALRNPSSA